MWATWAFCKVVHISLLTPYLSIKLNLEGGGNQGFRLLNSDHQ